VDVADRRQDGLTGWKKMRASYSAATDWRSAKMEVHGNVCLGRPGPA
jgi:hypothetical protein